MTRRNILIVHQNFPGQFPHVTQALLARGDKVAAIGSKTAKGVPGVDVRRWGLVRGTTPGIFEHAVRAEADLLRGAAAAAAAEALRRDGFVPDLILGHPGWGETLHLKEVFPDARMILLGEMFYRSTGSEVDFDPEFNVENRFAQRLDVNGRNVGGALSYVLADAIVCPTPFQASTFPPSLRARIRTHHEGIDVATAARRPDAVLKLPGGPSFRAGDPVITFINRTMEPVRGFHIFMRALAKLQASNPDVQAVVIGREAERGYGIAAPGGKTWKQALIDELGPALDLDRVHFLGTVPHDIMLQALWVSAAHVYLTYPFVVSWSLLEAMAAGCAIIASDTPPVRDAITDGVEGRLVDFFDTDALAATMGAAITDPSRFAPMREAAVARVRRDYDRATVGVPGWLEIIDSVP